MTSTLLQEQSGQIQILTLNRPDAMNALDNELLDALLEALRSSAALGQVRCVIVAGAGEKAFCAGIDLKQRSALSSREKMAQSAKVLQLNRAIWSAPFPVIAAIGGWCMGAGWELALHCDLRVASDDAKFSFPEMGLAAYPGAGGAVMLPRLIGLSAAKQILFTDMRLTAAQAQAQQLVDVLVPRAELASQANDLALRVAGCAPLALTALKRSMNEGYGLPLDAAYALDQALRRPLDNTRDYEEALRARVEKRKPQFRGE